MSDDLQTREQMLRGLIRERDMSETATDIIIRVRTEEEKAERDRQTMPISRAEMREYHRRIRALRYPGEPPAIQGAMVEHETERTFYAYRISPLAVKFQQDQKALASLIAAIKAEGYDICVDPLGEISLEKHPTFDPPTED